MVELVNVTIRSGSFHLSNISFEVPNGQYAVVMGKTGEGKTTILEAICGLRTVLAGRILLQGADVTQLHPADRGVGYVPQDLALFPTLTVREHLEFALRVRRASEQTVKARVGEFADLLGISHLLDRLPRGLSGGESQRVALGRALAFHPQVLLLDEPLSALDEETRHEMYELLKRVQRQTGVTTLHVTHTKAEAKSLAQRLLVLDSGAVRVAAVDDLAASSCETEAADCS
jgi:molybdate transport system ATP-binding protein/molybdate/tungstate transport system ATP-binding protein